MATGKNIRMAKGSICKIAIIGGGPKGMYGFERLAAQFKANPPSGQVEIHAYNRSDSFGAGENYHTGQPPYLLINNPIGDVNMWIDEAPPPVIPNPLSLTEWLRIKSGENVSEHYYADRASVGRYLKKGFELIATNLPQNVTGKYMVADVADIYQKGETYGIKLKTAGGKIRNAIHFYDHILLATGHPKNRETGQEKMYREFADNQRHAEFIPFVYPVQTAFSDVVPGSITAIKGIGLTFVDAVLALTKGKGGEFFRNPESGKLTYRPSGYEPKAIYPFSRSGLPMLPRKSMKGEEAPLRFFTEEMAEKIAVNPKTDFEKQIWPLLKKEMIFAYYSVEMKVTGFDENLSLCRDFDDVQKVVSDYHTAEPTASPFDLRNFLNPLDNKIFSSAEELNHFIKTYLEFYLDEAEKGENTSPWAAVIAVWRKVTPIFGELYSFGGLTPESQRVFDSVWRGRLNRVTFGPPVESVEKLVALMKAGILNFGLARNPSIELDEEIGTFVLTSNQFKYSQQVHFLVDARISKVSLPDDHSLLYRQLLERGIISMYRNELGDNSYKPGCIAISEGGFVIDKNGRINPNIAVAGTPTEGITFDNDSLSRYRNNFVSRWAENIAGNYAKSTVEQHAI